MARENGAKKRLGETNKEGGTRESSTSFPQLGSERGDPFSSRALKRSLAACFGGMSIGMILEKRCGPYPIKRTYSKLGNSVVHFEVIPCVSVPEH